MSKKEVKKGDLVTISIKVRRADGFRRASNYYEGEVTAIARKTKKHYFVKIEGLDRIVPIERVRAAQKAKGLSEDQSDKPFIKSPQKELNLYEK